MLPLSFGAQSRCILSGRYKYRDRLMSNVSRFAALIGLAASIPLVGTHSHAAEVMATKTLGAYRVDLHVLPAEPYVTKDEVASKHVTAGMEIEGGAPPVMSDAATHPNHHLIIFVVDKTPHRTA